MKDALQPMPRRGSRLSRAGIRAAVAGLALLLVATAVARAGLLGGGPAMAIYLTGSALLAAALAACGLGLLVSGGSAGSTSAPATWLALLAGLGVTANNAVLLGQGQGAPAIQDVSTDTFNPPDFVALVPIRADAGASPPDYAGAAAAAAQKSAYPDLQPVYFPRPANTVFDAALAAVGDLGWTLVDASAADGRIEATAESPWLRIREDVVIRIQPGRDQTRVDARSKSRAADGDRGANARRLREFTSALAARIAGPSPPT